MSDASTTRAVRAQYEAYPYPPRDPADEARRLVTTWLDDLPMLNHYGFAGRQSFRDGFRVLVAGGGTGDSTIFLAHQLRDTNAQVVHLDESRASTAVAKARAAQHGLSNIAWIEDSLLALPRLGLAPFDYVNCSGVLHHLPDPDAGLRALLSVTAEAGVLGVMVYALHGRTGVYQMQSLLRLLTSDEPALPRRIEIARKVLSLAPPGNWFRRGEDLHGDHLAGDAGLVDLLLHPQDRAYSVEELYAWFVDGHGLSIDLTDVGRGRSAYEPAMLVGPDKPEYLKAVASMPDRQRYAIGELLGGSLITHSFYAVRGASRRAPYGDPDYVPFFFHETLTGTGLADLMERQPGPVMPFHHPQARVSVDVEKGLHTPAILRHLDGQRSFGEIFERVRQQTPSGETPPATETLFADFRPLHDFLSSIDRLLLRHRSVQPVVGPGPAPVTGAPR